MIEEYVNKLIENLPDESKHFGCVDLILDGGLFNGSYLVGALYFIREMEKRNHLKIKRISGCSIGSVVAFLYFIDALDLMPKLYSLVNDEFKGSMSLQRIKQLKEYLGPRIPEDICNKVNGKLYICYHDIKCGKKIVKSHYKNVDQIIDVIVKSCFVPFLIDNNLLYKSKYVDGITAYVFKTESRRKILYLELLGYNNIVNALNIKNEKTNYHRILTGLLDVHSFFIKRTPTQMCSFVDEWSIINKCNYKAKLLLEKVIVYIIIFMNYLKQQIPEFMKNGLLTKIVTKVCHDIFCILLENYCL